MIERWYWDLRDERRVGEQCSELQQRRRKAVVGNTW